MLQEYIRYMSFITVIIIIIPWYILIMDSLIFSICFYSTQGSIIPYSTSVAYVLLWFILWKQLFICWIHILYPSHLVIYDPFLSSFISSYLLSLPHPSLPLSLSLFMCWYSFFLSSALFYNFSLLYYWFRFFVYFTTLDADFNLAIAFLTIVLGVSQLSLKKTILSEVAKVPCFLACFKLHR